MERTWEMTLFRIGPKKGFYPHAEEIIDIFTFRHLAYKREQFFWTPNLRYTTILLHP